MNIQKLLKNIILPLTVILSATSANAAVIGPFLDINGNGSVNGGVTITSNTFNIINANVGDIITGTGNNIVINELFNLTSTGAYSTSTGGSFTGTFTVGNNLLSGSFTGLIVNAPSSIFGGPFKTKFDGDLVYTGGTLQGSLTGGRIEGNFTDSTLLAKLGAVSTVPVPAAAWLFGSGLLGLVGVARRRA